MSWMNLAPQRVSHNLVLLEINVLSILEEPKSRGELLLKVRSESTKKEMRIESWHFKTVIKVGFSVPKPGYDWKMHPNLHRSD